MTVFTFQTNWKRLTFNYPLIDSVNNIDPFPLLIWLINGYSNSELKIKKSMKKYRYCKLDRSNDNVVLKVMYWN